MLASVDVAGDQVYHRERKPDARPRWRALAGALLLLPAVAVRAQEVEPSLWRRLECIEKAFRQADAEALRPSFPSEGKVRVQLPELTSGSGSYGAGQLQVLFGRIFRDQATESFSFPRRDVRISTDGTAFARARWVRKHPAASGDGEDVLTFTLRQDDGDWRIHEVRSSR